MKHTDFVSADFLTLPPGPGHSKLYKRVQVLGAYNYGKHGRIWYNSLQVMFNKQVVAMQDCKPASQIDTIDYTDFQVT